MKKKKVICILIAYNEAENIKKFWKSLPKKYFDEVILVDDASKDETFEIAEKIKGINAYQNKTNLGYGGNLKRAINIALDHGADILVDIHPDNEYKPSAIPLALEKVSKKSSLFVMGNRFIKSDTILKSGMYAWKILPLTLLNFIDRSVLKLNITDFHQGFRVYTRELFEKVNFEANSNNYLFSFEIIAQAALLGLKVDEVPVETYYSGKKRGVSLKNGIKYSFGTFIVLGKYVLAKVGIKLSIFQKPKGSLIKRVSSLI